MPTIKPKRTFVFSSESARRVIEGSLSDRCEIAGTNMSEEIEGILMDALLPEGLAEFAMTEIYLNAKSVQDELSIVLADNAAGVNWKAKRDDMRPLVELAARQSHGILLGPHQSLYHLRESWLSVCNLLGQAKKEDVRYEGDEACARDLLCVLENEPGSILCKRFFDNVLLNWDVLGNSTHSFRALSDVVEAAVSWPDDARAREAFKACLSSIGGE